MGFRAFVIGVGLFDVSIIIEYWGKVKRFVTASVEQSLSLGV